MFEEDEGIASLATATTTKTRKIPKIYGFQLGQDKIETINRIYVIGCGGNGSHLAPHLARFISTLPHKPMIVFIDADKVESKNLIRQHFIEQDIGINKAEVLATRYGNAFNTPTSFITEYLLPENKSRLFSDAENYGQTQFFITCTDNLKSRQLIADHKRSSVWIDLGNEETSGQVSVSYHSNEYYSRSEIKNNTAFEIPNVFEIYNDYRERAKNEIAVNQISCAEMSAAAPVQSGFVNLTAATVAMNYIQALLTRKPVKNYMTLFSTDNVFEHKTITQETAEDWKRNYVRFSNTKIG